MGAQRSHLGTRGLKSATAGMSLGGGHVLTGPERTIAAKGGTISWVCNASGISLLMTHKISRIETNSSSVLIGPELEAGVKIWTQILKHSLPGKSGRENGMKERL
jgi:hypothetical protein